MANEKKMRQIQEKYKAEKGKPGITLSKLCKEQNVKVSEYAQASNLGLLTKKISRPG